MPARGSAIGASALYGGAFTGRAASPTTQATGYAVNKSAAAGGYTGPTIALLALVALEVLALVLMRRGFAPYHGG